MARIRQSSRRNIHTCHSSDLSDFRQPMLLPLSRVTHRPHSHTHFGRYLPWLNSAISCHVMLTHVLNSSLFSAHRTVIIFRIQALVIYIMFGTILFVPFTELPTQIAPSSATVCRNTLSVDAAVTTLYPNVQLTEFSRHVTTIVPSVYKSSCTMVQSVPPSLIATARDYSFSSLIRAGARPSS